MSEIQERILRAKEVRKRLGGISNTTFWRLRKHDFPKSVKIRGTSIKGWLETSITKWIVDNSEGEE